MVGIFGVANLACDLGTGACNFVVASKIGHRAPIFFDVGEVRALGVVGARFTYRCGFTARRRAASGRPVSLPCHLPGTKYRRGR